MKKEINRLVKSRTFRVALLFFVFALVFCVSAFAEDDVGTSGTTSAISSAFTTGFNQMVADSLALISAMVPPAVSIGAVVFLVRKAMSWFKSMAK